MKRNVIAIVVTYNRKSKLKKCIESIYNQSVCTDILVVDNNSDDGTYEYLNSLCDDGRVKVIHCSSNYGGAGGFNIGIKEAYKQGYEFFWLMDDDAYPEMTALETLFNASDELEENYGFLYSKVVWNDGQICFMNEPKFKRFRNRNKNGYRELMQASFVSFFTRKEVVKKVGFPIKDFFIWADDVEFSRRIAVINRLKSYYVEDSVIVHDTQNNVGSSIAYDCKERINRYYYAYRNEFFLYHQEGVSGIVYYVFKVIWNLMKIFFVSENKADRFGVMIKAIKDGQRFKPQIERPND